MSKWVDHFKSLLLSERKCETQPTCDEEGPLDFKISYEELIIASAILKSGKSPGIDNITNEMIVCVLKYYPDILMPFQFDSLNRQFNTSMVSGCHCPNT